MAKTLVFMTCGICFLGGCAVLRVCPQIEGSVVEGVTGAPIKSATVTVVYNTSGYLNPHSELATQTDSQGRYLFKAKSDVFVWVPMPFDPACGFTLQAKADGYSVSEVHRYGPWMGLEPPPTIAEPPTGSPKMAYRGEIIVIGPIKLVPSPVRAPVRQ